MFSDSTEGSVISPKSPKIGMKNEINFLATLRLLLKLNGSQEHGFSVPWDSEVITRFIEDLESQVNVDFRDIGKFKEIF